MIIQDFLNWVDTAPDGPRAEAAGALARAWLYSDLDGESRRGANAALTYLLDDPCVDVRMALADSLCRSHTVPRHLLLCLASDTSEVAGVVLATSPIFTDAELIDALASSEEDLQEIVAGRLNLSAAVSAAVAEVGSEAACRRLLSNGSARIVPTSLIRLAERFRQIADLRETLLNRADLPIQLRHALLLLHAQVLGARDTNPNMDGFDNAPDMFADASDKIALRLSERASGLDLDALADYLRDEGLLNTRLLLRTVCCGRFRFLASSLALLSGVPGDRVFRALIAARPPALRAILRKAGLPIRTHQAFLLAIDVAREAGADLTSDLPLDQTRALTECLLAELQDEALGADGDILAFMRRFAVDVARLEARAYINSSCQKALSAA